MTGRGVGDRGSSERWIEVVVREQVAGFPSAAGVVGDVSPTPARCNISVTDHLRLKSENRDKQADHRLQGLGSTTSTGLSSMTYSRGHEESQ